MSFRPDSPLNRLVILWPGVPIAACALGFVLAVIEVSQTHSGSFAALAIAMGCGLAFSVGLLFHSFFIEWTEVTVTREGIALRPVGHVWLNRPPRLVPGTACRAPTRSSPARAATSRSPRERRWSSWIGPYSDRIPSKTSVPRW